MGINYRKQIMELIYMVYPNGLPDNINEMIVNMRCPDDEIRPYHLKFDPYEYELHRTGQLDTDYVMAHFSERDATFLKQMNISLGKTKDEDPA